MFRPIVLAVASTAMCVAQHPPLRIGFDRQLFVDDYVIGSLDKVSLQLHSPMPAGKAIAFDQPWEGNVSAYVTVFRDGDRVRMYYRGASAPEYVNAKALRPDEKLHPAHPAVTCYAESRDGIAWTRPELGLIDFNGSKRNNIVMTGTPSINFAPFRDDNPVASAAERYKAVGGDAKGLVAYASPDAIRWKPMREEAILKDGLFDSLNVVFWDARRNLYVAVYRDFLQGVRTVKTATSPDFLHWTAGEWADYGSAPAEQLYTNATTPYFRAPQIYLAFPKRYIANRKPFDDVPGSGVSEAVFMTSRDGIRWDRRFLEAFVRPGRDRRDWVHRTHMPATGLIETAPDEISLYVSRHYSFPDASLERMTLRTDGFVSAHADYRGGELVTKPLFLEGSAISFNFATSAAGSIRWELLDRNGNPLPGFSLDETKMLYGDEIDHVVRIQDPNRNSSSGLGARPVQIRFVMKDADLYSFQVRW